MALEGIRRLTSAVEPTNTTANAAGAAPARAFSAEMKRIAAHAESVETLKNGAKLYRLANGREIEQMPGKSPYVTKQGTVPSASTPASATHTPTTTATTPTTLATPATGATTGTTPTSGSKTTTSK